MNVSGLDQSSCKLSHEGVLNLRMQMQAYQKYNAGEKLSEAERAIIERRNVIKADDATVKKIYESAASLRISKLGLKKLEDLSKLEELPGKLVPVDNAMMAAYKSKKTEKTGYAKEFDDVSKDYAELLLSHKNKEAGDMDVLTKMQEKYDELKGLILSDYEGDEQAEKLKKLNKDYQDVLKENVSEPMNIMIKHEDITNKLQMEIARLKEKAAMNKGEDASAYRELQKRLIEDRDSINSTRTMADKLSELFKAAGSGAGNNRMNELFAGISQNLQMLYNARVSN